MSALSPASRHATPAQPIVLDPCTLGRPYHLLGDVLQDVQRRIDHLLHERFNLRRGTHFCATRAVIAAIRQRDTAGWRAYASQDSQLHVRASRQLMLALLACHYDTPFHADTEPGPETGTERRFAAHMHAALLGALASVVGDSEAQALAPAADTLPGAGARALRITIEDAARSLAGDIEFALDGAWLARLFARIDTQRKRAPITADGTPAGRRIPVCLTVRMLTKDMALDDLLRMRRGDVLPVRLPDTADVLVNDVRVYRGALAEQQGAVCITAFEPVE